MLIDLLANHTSFTLQSKVESGEYVLGEMIVPQTFKKVTLTKGGHLKTETFTVSGRKIPLLEIRKSALPILGTTAAQILWCSESACASKSANW